jgi:small multidrug resistance family-3 protein
MKSLLLFALAALLEIAGCFAFWACLREGRSPWLLVAGVSSLISFALVLSQVEMPHAARAYAAYGGVYVAASMAWLYGIEKVAPDRWDILGVAVCIAGTLIIRFAPRA